MSSGSEATQHNPSYPYGTGSHYTAVNPYQQMGSSSLMGGNTGFSGYSGYSSFSPYSSYGGYGSPLGYGSFNSMQPDHLWQGYLGQAAESLGRMNNLLSMTGMLVDHISNHTKLIYQKGLEVHGWYKSMRNWSEKHSEWMERLGLQIESGWLTNEDEEVRRRRMFVRRTRTFLILGFILMVFYLMRRRMRPTRQQKWEAVYQYNAPRPY